MAENTQAYKRLSHIHPNLQAKKHDLYKKSPGSIELFNFSPITLYKTAEKKCKERKDFLNFFLTVIDAKFRQRP